MLSHGSLFLNRVLLFPLWGQEGVLGGVFIDGKTEKEGLRQICPVFSHARGDVKEGRKFFLHRLSWAHKQCYIFWTAAAWKSLLIPAFIMYHLVIWIIYESYSVSHHTLIPSKGEILNERGVQKASMRSPFPFVASEWFGTCKNYGMCNNKKRGESAYHIPNMYQSLC